MLLGTPGGNSRQEELLFNSILTGSLGCEVSAASVRILFCSLKEILVKSGSHQVVVWEEGVVTLFRLRIALQC